MIGGVSMNDIQRVGIVGCGLMGSGIAEVCARAGRDVIVFDVDSAALERGRSRVLGSLDRAEQRGKLAADDRLAVLDRIAFTTDLDSFGDRDLAVEAIVERERDKVELSIEASNSGKRPFGVSRGGSPAPGPRTWRGAGRCRRGRSRGRC
jgi:3-hydroxybutyryl-CoA dehydrogenase